ncbi:HTH-type transcriptional regulator GanR [Propionispora sp. 2/2-37]|nr:HTH-type transcriptional regulator GanR [Propionispora sp. 2/2-37]
MSIATVSRVLNYDATLSVSDETKRKVFEAAEDLAYEKRTPRKNGGTRIALLHWYTEEEELDDVYYMSIRLGIERRCKQYNLTLVRLLQNNTAQLARENIQGMIAVGKFSQHEIALLKEKTSNLVFVDYLPDDDYFDSVTVDFVKATRKVLDYFISQGHQMIGYIGGREVFRDGTSEIQDPREATFKAYLKEKKIYQEKYVYGGKFSVDDGYRLMKQAIAEHGAASLPTAFFVANDPMAIGCLKALEGAEIAVPERVGIIGVNDISLAQYVSPSLSTVRIDTELMGETAVDLLLERLSGRRTSKQVTLSTELILRQSSK